MAERYPKRSFPAGDGYDSDMGSRASGHAESDPLAELARLIGQTDPFGAKPMSRANLPVQPQARPADPRPAQGGYHDSYHDSYYEDSEPEEPPPSAPPSWMQRAATRQEVSPPPQPQDDYPSSVHPLHRYAAAHPPAEPEPDYDREQFFAESGHEPDPSRYDDALYGGFDSDAQHAHDQGYADDGYAYEEDQQFEDQPQPKRRGGLITVAAVLALAVFGVGGALAYRTYTGSGRNNAPPIIRADAGPTKIIPAPADASTKVPDRMVSGDGSEKIVSREETPIDPSSRSAGPRVVFPPLTPNASAPLPSGVMPGATSPTTSAANGTFTNNEPHQVRTFSVRGDQGTAGAPAAATPPSPAPAKPLRAAAATSARPSTTSPTAANANSPLSLAPQTEASAAAEPVRVAATNPAQVVPAAPSTPSAAASGSYLVSVTSQPSEAEAQASYRALQGKYPSVLGSQSAVVARANSKSGTVTYRAGPSFGTPAEASQFCHNYQAAGGQCWVVKN
jgi:hypothetical protein